MSDRIHHLAVALRRGHPDRSQITVACITPEHTDGCSLDDAIDDLGPVGLIEALHWTRTFDAFTILKFPLLVHERLLDPADPENDDPTWEFEVLAAWESEERAR